MSESPSQTTLRGRFSNSKVMSTVTQIETLLTNLGLKRSRRSIYVFLCVKQKMSFSPHHLRVIGAYMYPARLFLHRFLRMPIPGSSKAHHILLKSPWYALIKQERQALSRRHFCSESFLDTLSRAFPSETVKE